MQVGDKVRVWKQGAGEAGELDGVATVRELQYGEEWADGCKAEVEFDDQPGRTYARPVFEKDRIPPMEERVGTEVQIMCHGHVVDAKILGTKEVFPGTPAGDPPVHEFECEFICHHDSGAKMLCLDFGQKWYIEAGEKFGAGEKAIERAHYWMAKHPPLPHQIADQIRANIRAWFDEQVDDDQFNSRAKALWDKARQHGIDEAVLAIVCPEGPKA